MPAASRRTSLVRRLFGTVFAWYVVLTMGITVVQLGWVYHATANTIRRDLAALARSFKIGISDAVWNYETALVEAMARGIAQNPVVTAVCITNASGKVIAGAQPVEDDSDRLIYRLPLEFVKADGKIQALGQLAIASSPQIIYTRIRDDLITILVNSLATTSALWLIFTIVITRTLSRPLQRLAATVSALGDSTLAEEAEPLHYSHRDELGILVDALNDMRRRLRHSQRELEDKVRDRTRALEETNAKLIIAHDALEQASITDRLTGLFNRRRLDEVFTSEVARAKRYASTLSVIITDIDKFKSVNDDFGHQAGDTVLREFAAILCDIARKTDTVGRWGGEEFMIICPETDLDAACRLAERMREASSARDFPSVGIRTASFGVASFRAGDKEADLIKRADDALYRAKAGGRNRIEREDATA